MKNRTWSEEVLKRHKFHKDSVEVIEFNKNPQRSKKYVRPGDK